MNLQIDTIVAQCTPNGSGALAIIRLSGPTAFTIANVLLQKEINSSQIRQAIFGNLYFNHEVIDEVISTYFKGPHSYTGEDVVEFSCHGSSYIIEQIMSACIQQGAQIAKAGEFTQRAFLHGKLNLVQAESVADLIASENALQHKVALHQMRGGFTSEIAQQRQSLIEFAALLELELDFSEEDVEFADKTKLQELLNSLQKKLITLQQSFALGNAIKKGIPVAIIGKPNAGKSTLLNALLQEEKAIVSPIAGTTRDIVEDIINIGGITYRFIDTAGIRTSTDTIENLGIEKSFQKMKQASLVFVLVDAADPVQESILFYESLAIDSEQEVVFIINKIDTIGTCNGYDVEEAIATLSGKKCIAISAKSGLHVNSILEFLEEKSKQTASFSDATIITNARHKEA
jgi:tRNA modification GTPase